MTQSIRKTAYLVAVFLICCGAIILSSVAYGTQYWIEESATSKSDNTSDPSAASHVNIHIGLFHGMLSKSSIVSRSEPIYVKEKYDSDHGFMNFGLWITTMLFLALAILFGVVTAVFAAINSAITPIEQITGVPGIYLWNGIATLCSLLTILLWIGQYYSHFIYILKSFNGIPPGIDTNTPSNFGYSFYLVVGAMILHLANNLFIFLSTCSFNTEQRKLSDINEKPTDGTMLY